MFFNTPGLITRKIRLNEQIFLGLKVYITYIAVSVNMNNIMNSLYMMKMIEKLMQSKEKYATTPAIA